MIRRTQACSSVSIVPSGKHKQLVIVDIKIIIIFHQLETIITFPRVHNNFSITFLELEISNTRYMAAAKERRVRAMANVLAAIFKSFIA